MQLSRRVHCRCARADAENRVLAKGASALNNVGTRERLSASFVSVNTITVVQLSNLSHSESVQRKTRWFDWLRRALSPINPLQTQPRAGSYFLHRPTQYMYVCERNSSLGKKWSGAKSEKRAKQRCRAGSCRVEKSVCAKIKRNIAARPRSLFDKFDPRSIPRASS